MAGVDPNLQRLVDDVLDRLLVRAAALFPDVELAAGFGAGPVGADTPPAGGGGLSGRIEDAGGEWARRRSALQRLDERGAEIVEAAGQAAAEGRSAVERLREQARAQVAAILPETDTAAGALLLISTLDRVVGELQDRIAAGRQAQTEAAAELRELADAYKAAVG